MTDEQNQNGPAAPTAVGETTFVQTDPNASREAEERQRQEAEEAAANRDRETEGAPEVKRTEAVATMSGSGASFPGFPLTKYNPVLGARTAKDPNEAASLFQPEHDWWPTAAEADMHRTEREAGMVVHQNMRDKLDGLAEAQDGAKPVRLSVQAQESIDAGNPEPV